MKNNLKIDYQEFFNRDTKPKNKDFEYKAFGFSFIGIVVLIIIANFL